MIKLKQFNCRKEIKIIYVYKNNKIHKRETLKSDRRTNEQTLL